MQINFPNRIAEPGTLRGDRVINCTSAITAVAVSGEATDREPYIIALQRPLNLRRRRSNLMELRITKSELSCLVAEARAAGWEV